MLAKAALLRYNNYSDKKRVIICVLKGILDVCFSVKSAQKKALVFTSAFFNEIHSRGTVIKYFFIQKQRS